MQDPISTSPEVTGPAYYRDEASGVECREISRHMGAQLGQAFQYVWRGWSSQKHQGAIDLEKALFWVRDWIANPSIGQEAKDSVWDAFQRMASKDGSLVFRRLAVLQNLYTADTAVDVGTTSVIGFSVALIERRIRELRESSELPLAR